MSRKLRAPQTTFGATVRFHRKRLGQTQEQLADRVGALRQEIANIEAGLQDAKSLGSDRAAKLVKILQLDNPPGCSKLGQFVRAKRHALGYSQRELAELCGTSRHVIDSIERGVRGLLTIAEREKMADILGPEIRELPV